MSSPRMGAVARQPFRPATKELEEETEVGDLYLTALLRSQLRSGLAVLVVVVAALAGIPLLFVTAPALSHVHLGPVPLPWLLLGVAVYPLLLAAAWWHVRTAERVERDWADILRRR